MWPLWASGHYIEEPDRPSSTVAENIMDINIMSNMYWKYFGAKPPLNQFGVDTLICDTG